MIPEAAIENCGACAKAGGLIDTKCRGCVARYVSRLMPTARTKWYVQARAEHGESVVDAFKRDVAVWMERARSVRK